MQGTVIIKKLLLSIIILIIFLLGFIYFHPKKINMEKFEKAEVLFLYENNNELHSLSDKELELVKSIFNGKKIYKDNLSCGFSENISIKFDQEHTFCIARDTCPIVYWKEKDRYIKLSDDEKTQLYNLLEPYGFHFPCL